MADLHEMEILRIALVALLCLPLLYLSVVLTIKLIRDARKKAR